MPLELQMSSMLTAQQRELGELLSKQLSVEWADTVLIPIISGAHAVSIRIMDWYITNYTLAHGTSYMWTDPKSKESRLFSVHLEYSTTLNSKGRPLFDPFRRGPRVFLSGSNGMVHESTLGQIFFWKWVTRYNVLDALMRPGVVERTQAHMAKQQQIARERKNATGKRKRASLSKKAAHPLVRADENKRVYMIRRVQSTFRFDDSDLEDNQNEEMDDDEAGVAAKTSSDEASDVAARKSSETSSQSSSVVAVAPMSSHVSSGTSM